MKFKHSLKNYAILCALVVLALLAVYGTLVINGNIQNTQPNPITVSSEVNCSFPDKTFCSTDQLFRNLVSRQDFSDILENQTPTTVTCTPSLQTEPYCKNVQNGLEMQLFQVKDDQGSHLLTRNDYIDYFRSYFQQYGPFTFGSETAAGPNVTMLYTNASHSAQYVLTFSKQDSTWKLVYVTASTS